MEMLGDLLRPWDGREERNWRCRLKNQEVIKRMANIHLAAAQGHPIPFARDIAKRVQAIPGWFTEEEGELLIALVLSAIMDHKFHIPPILVEIGSYCGRATTAMGLAVHGIGRNDVRILAIDEPGVGRAPDGRPPQDVLREQLAANGLSDIVICAPEDDAEPWQHPSRLLLVDGQHDYAGVRDDVEKYASRIAPGGYLVFHDYADYCPGVQRFVSEMLVDEDCPFEFVAHVNTLVAFVRHPAATTENGGLYPIKHTLLAPTVWMYWEGPMPAYISLCCRTIFTHNEHVRLLNRASFDDLFMHDRDINIDALGVQHRSDFIRAYLLKHYGGLYLDVDCVVMRSLSPLLELAKRYGFVGYREQQGNMSNGLLVAEAYNEVIAEHYHSVCASLRSGVHLEWCDLGAVSLDKVMTEFPGKYHLQATESIMPINWYHSEVFVVQRSDNEHERYLQSEAFCYMLSNSTLSGREQTKVLTMLTEEELLNAKYFLSFLFRRALS
jgi:hypothetical protein